MFCWSEPTSFFRGANDFTRTLEPFTVLPNFLQIWASVDNCFWQICTYPNWFGQFCTCLNFRGNTGKKMILGLKCAETTCFYQW